MALSMEEQRILAEIETHLRRDDPKLAERLSRLGRRRWRRRSAVAVTALAIVAVLVMLVV